MVEEGLVDGTTLIYNRLDDLNVKRAENLKIYDLYKKIKNLKFSALLLKNRFPTPIIISITTIHT